MRATFDHVIDGLGDVGGMIADTLHILRTEQSDASERDVTRILHHVGEELAEQRRTKRVDLSLHSTPRARPARSWLA